MHRLLALAILGLLLAACAPKPEGGLSDVSPPASNPASASAAEMAHHALGERFNLDDEEYLTATQVSSWTGTEFVKPSDNNSFVSVEVKVEGINADGASVDPFWFHLEDSQMQPYDVVESGQDPMLQQTDALAPGTVASGWLTFEIPEDEGHGLDLIYAPPFSDPVRIDLD